MGDYRPTTAWAQGARGTSQEKVRRARPWTLTQFHLLHGKLAAGTIECLGAAALEAIPLTSILAPDLLELTVIPREPRGAEAVALSPGATIVAGAWATQEKGKFRIGPDLGDTRL